MLEPTASVRWLEAFYGDSVSKDARFTIWTFHNRAHYWCSDISSAFKNFDLRRDTYFSMAVYPRGITRRTKDNASAIFGVWLDVDCGDKGNSKDYFPTVEKALAWVTDTLCGRWSFIIHSGGGLHVYLMFDEPFWIESDEDRTRAAKLTKAFHSWADNLCPHTIDPIYDLARVMRLPGTTNTRTGNIAYVLDESGEEVSFSDLEEFLPPVELNETSQVSSIDGEADIEDVKSTISMLREADKTFDLTWKRQRRLKDRSPSGYCMSIANSMAAAGCRDVEIVTALKMWRASQTDAVEKPESWYEITLSKARKMSRPEIIGVQVSAALETDDAVEQMEKISLVLGREVSEIRKRVIPEYKGHKEKSSYEFIFTDDSTVLLPNTETLMSQEKMRNALFEEIGVLMQRLKGAKWDDFLRLVLANVTEITEELEGNTSFNLENELHAFVQKKRESGNLVQSLDAMGPTTLYEEDGVTYFKWNAFKRHLLGVGMIGLKTNAVARMLKDLGAESRQFGDAARSRLWSVPPKGVSDE